jgi:hypothetical protein
LFHRGFKVRYLGGSVELRNGYGIPDSLG